MTASGQLHGRHRAVSRGRRHLLRPVGGLLTPGRRARAGIAIRDGALMERPGFPDPFITDGRLAYSGTGLAEVLR
jgi:hypothetical protein